MKVIMQETMASAHEVLRKGFIYDLSPKRALKYIDRALAKPLVEDQTRVPVKRKTSSLPHGEKN